MSDKRIWQVVIIGALVAFLIWKPEPEPQAPKEPTVNLNQYFNDWADTVAGDDFIIKNTDQWRTAFEQASQLLIGGTNYVSVKERTENINFIIAEAIGIDNRPLDKSLRAKLIEALKEIAKNVENTVASYRPQIAITTAMYIIESDARSNDAQKVDARSNDPDARSNDARTNAQVGHQEAQRRSMAGEWVWVQLSSTSCGPCKLLEKNIFPYIQTNILRCTIVDKGPEWGVYNYPTSVLVAPGWFIKERVKTPSTLLGVESMLRNWRKYD